jgi:UDP-3-O-[3-hydroxymyristoyl] N-acetylglucosamine deacetylase
MLDRQQTISRCAEAEGVGLHTGERVRMLMQPAPEGMGVVFRRTDMGGALIPARVDAVQPAQYATVLAGEGGATVSTVEHLLSAAFGMGVDNLLVDLDGPELPILDGSALPFVEMFQKAGFAEQRVPRRYLAPRRTLAFRHGRSYITLGPADTLKISYMIDFPNTPVGRQEVSLYITPSLYEREIAPARTFGFEQEFETLRSWGLIKGGSLDNAIVVGRDGVVNKEGLRFSDEFVRHKILDALGDMALAGAPLCAQLIASKAGHSAHTQALRQWLGEAGALEAVDSSGIAFADLARSSPALAAEAAPF